MAIAIGDIYRATMEWRLEGQQCYTVLHCRVNTNASAGATINQFLTGTRDRLVAIAAAILADGTPELSLTKISVFAIHTTADPHGAEYEQTAQGAGTGSDPMPGFVAAVLYHSTGLVGRSNRGRSHILGLMESHCEGGLLSTAGEAHLTTVQAAYANNWITTTLSNAVVFSRTKFETDPFNATANIVGYDWSPVLGSMYSRRLGIGQ